MSLLRVATLAAWVTHHQEAYCNLLERLLQRAPDTPLPHLLRIAERWERPIYFNTTSLK